MTQYGQVQKNREARQVDIRRELAEFEKMLEELKIQYEQYFIGVLPFQPEKLHTDVKRKLRHLFKLPCKNSATGFQLKMLENRYSSYHSYWLRILKEKEEGVYSRDVFKAGIRERQVQQDADNNSVAGAANKQLHDLFQTYKATLEKETKRTQQIDFNEFKKSLVQQAKVLREQHGVQKFSFKVAVKNGKVTVSAHIK
jgi:hypothetical protein